MVLLIMFSFEWTFCDGITNALMDFFPALFGHAPVFNSW